jgi:hypothetical protein
LSYLHRAIFRYGEFPPSEETKRMIAEDVQSLIDKYRYLVDASSASGLLESEIALFEVTNRQQISRPPSNITEKMPESMCFSRKSGAATDPQKGGFTTAYPTAPSKDPGDSQTNGHTFSHTKPEMKRRKPKLSNGYKVYLVSLTFQTNPHIRPCSNAP